VAQAAPHQGWTERSHIVGHNKMSAHLHTTLPPQCLIPNTTELSVPRLPFWLLPTMAHCLPPTTLLVLLVASLRSILGAVAQRPGGGLPPSNDIFGPSIDFPGRNHPTYNFWDSVNVSWSSLWDNGVNLTVNCWKGSHGNEKPVFMTLYANGSDCSPCMPFR
jgi:hypothetical protein